MPSDRLNDEQLPSFEVIQGLRKTIYFYVLYLCQTVTDLFSTPSRSMYVGGMHIDSMAAGCLGEKAQNGLPDWTISCMHCDAGVLLLTLHILGRTSCIVPLKIAQWEDKTNDWLKINNRQLPSASRTSALTTKAIVVQLDI